MNSPAMVWIVERRCGQVDDRTRPGAPDRSAAAPIDLWTYDHAARMPSQGSLAKDLARRNGVAADAFARIARTRLELVTADCVHAGLGDVPALVEGPQLFPAMADDGPAAVRSVPDAEQTRRAP